MCSPAQVPGQGSEEEWQKGRLLAVTGHWPAFLSHPPPPPTTEFRNEDSLPLPSRCSPVYGTTATGKASPSAFSVPDVLLGSLCM